MITIDKIKIELPMEVRSTIGDNILIKYWLTKLTFWIEPWKRSFTNGSINKKVMIATETDSKLKKLTANNLAE